jgi:hypothetical protein
MKERIPATPRPTASIKLKHLHKKFGQGQSLKDYVRNSLETDEDKQLGDNWFFNKKANFSKPPKGIGSTRRKKGKGGKSGKPEEKK